MSRSFLQHGSRRRARAFAGSAAAFVLCLSGQAAAQGIALDRFEPAQPGDRFFGVDSPYVPGHLVPHVMLLGDYAHDPLVVRTEDGETVDKIVEHQLVGHLSVSLPLWSRVALDVDLPVALYQAGDSTTTLAAPDTTSLGDLRLGARVRLFGEYFDPLQIGLGGYVWAPTGSQEAYASDGEVRGEPVLLLGGRTKRFVWSFATGPELRPTRALGNATQGHMLRWGVGGAVLLLEERTLQVGPEASGTVVFEDPQKRTTNFEAMLGAKYRFAHDWETGAAIGPGFSPGIGTPDVRVVASLTYTPEVIPPSEDQDGDGIRDPEDACPAQPGIRTGDPKTNGCPDGDGDDIVDSRDACPTEEGVETTDPKTNGCPPPKDEDEDGILDEVDACVDVPGVKTDDPKTNGCPKDSDGDGVADANDACADIPGIKTDDPKTNGCPGDTDGDGIRDDKDACPREKGKPNTDPTLNGCPVAVRVTSTEIVILEQVQFDTGRATIKKASDPLLDQVAEVLAEHPEIRSIEVQGHTDDVGPAGFNKRLSGQRAEAVKKALVARKIDPGRLTAKGYGPDAPIADNKTPEGRQKNRRVQFKIIEKKP